MIYGPQTFYAVAAVCAYALLPYEQTSSNLAVVWTVFLLADGNLTVHLWRDIGGEVSIDLKDYYFVIL